MKTIRFLLAVPALLIPPTAALADHVILDDCIIDGSMAVGLDSVNGENFGFDTLRLKENNLRFHFDDTSVSASFPRNDWRLIANDSANGGDSYLGIEDATAGRIPFRVEAGAASHSLFVESTGDVGFGTNSPVVKVHLTDGDTPTVRLEQNGSSGWNPQTWDVAGNETNFFIRDVTNGSKLPFRIRPNAPTNSIEIKADGNVALQKSITVGNSEPELRLVLPDAGNGVDFPAMRVGDAFLSSGAGFAHLSTNNWYDGSQWSANAKAHEGMLLQMRPTGVYFWKTGSGAAAPPSFANLLMGIDANGNVTTMGTVNGVSDRNRKSDINEVDTGSVLERVAKMPISTWRYSWEDGVTHMGPMAQDFWAEFKLGLGDKTISPFDTAGVALASIQELNKQLNKKERRIQDLEDRNRALEERLQRIEEALGARP